jgi:DNA-binding response OmpR family regulator
MLEILQNYSLLYVEDEPEIQANMKEYLESYFHSVDIASDGEEALKLYTKNRYDVLLLDINLPYLDGLSVAKKVREKDENAKILMLTAHTDQDKLLAAVELKLTKYLVKPLTPKVFKEALNALAQELCSSSSNFVKFSNNFFWDKERKSLLSGDKEVSLLEKERRLLRLLIENRSKVVSYEDIMINLWDDAFERDISIDSVKNQIRTLRKKIPENVIYNVYGQGYIFR